MAPATAKNRPRRLIPLFGRSIRFELPFAEQRSPGPEIVQLNFIPQPPGAAAPTSTKSSNG
jgi:hypothetical protein